RHLGSGRRVLLCHTAAIVARVARFQECPAVHLCSDCRSLHSGRLHGRHHAGKARPRRPVNAAKGYMTQTVQHPIDSAAGTKQGRTGSDKPPELDAAGATHIGHKRNENQDAFFIASTHNALMLHQASNGLKCSGINLGRRSGTLLALADGMGGAGDGSLASRLSLEAVANYMLNVASLEPNPLRDDEPSSVDSRVSIPKLREHLEQAFVEGERS